MRMHMRTQRLVSQWRYRYWRMWKPARRELSKLYNLANFNPANENDLPF